jgi:hypothetical protein
MNGIDQLKQEAFEEIAQKASDCFDAIRKSNNTLSYEMKMLIQEAVSEMKDLNAESQKELTERLAGQDITIAGLKGKIWPRWVMWLIVSGLGMYIVSSAIPWIVLSKIIIK